jgi:hypothetical protein
MIDKDKFFDAGIEFGYPYEFVAHWLEVFAEVAPTNTDTSTFVDYLKDRAEG